MCIPFPSLPLVCGGQTLGLELCGAPKNPGEGLELHPQALSQGFHSCFNLSVIFSPHSQCCEAEQAADRHRCELGRRPPPRQEIGGFRLLLRQRHRPGHPGAPQVWAAPLTPLPQCFLLRIFILFPIFFSCFPSRVGFLGCALLCPKGICPAGGRSFWEHFAAALCPSPLPPSRGCDSFWLEANLTGGDLGIKTCIKMHFFG